MNETMHATGRVALRASLRRLGFADIKRRIKAMSDSAAPNIRHAIKRFANIRLFNAIYAPTIKVSRLFLVVISTRIHSNNVKPDTTLQAPFVSTKTVYTVRSGSGAMNARRMTDFRKFLLQKESLLRI